MNAAGFKRLPENMRKKVIETYHLTEAEASILGDARNFGVDIDPSDWPKVGPFTEVHNFYSPARSNLGKIVFKSPKFSEDLLMFGNILMEAIASDLNS